MHDDALAVLRAWTPPDADQDRLRRRYVHHLEQNADGMLRSCLPDHVTAGALVLSADGTEALLNLHGKARQWFAFGGHCELDDTTLAGVAHREALEESGLARLDFDPSPVQLNEHDVPFCDPRGTVAHLDVRFVAVAPPGAEHRVSDESLDVRWWPLDALPDGLGSDMHDLISAARGRLGEA
ncbi:NUDIX hydrolase [Nocardioides sp. Soil797]|nr:NUDIX hydrolase [Nocardioides sp. Soil797]